MGEKVKVAGWEVKENASHYKNRRQTELPHTIVTESWDHSDCRILYLSRGACCLHTEIGIATTLAT